MPGPDVWGPHGWKFIHYITLGYPNNPTEEDKKKYYNFFHSLKYVIPCSICGAHFIKNLEKTPITPEVLSSKMKLIEWGITMHNHVNASNNKKIYTFEEGLASILENNREKCDTVETFTSTSTSTSNNTLILSISIILNILLLLLLVYKLYKK
jgi:hypothetical protein